jgi:hypothetical protein
MGSIFRDPGTETVIGLASFAVSFIAIWLSAATLGYTEWAGVAFVIAVLLLVVSAICMIILLNHRSKTKKYIQHIRYFLKQGRNLRKELLTIKTVTEWTDERQGKVPKWKENVQKWLNDNLPDYASDFDLESAFTTLNTVNMNVEAARAAEHLEARMLNLKEILSDLRS